MIHKKCVFCPVAQNYLLVGPYFQRKFFNHNGLYLQHLSFGGCGRLSFWWLKIHLDVWYSCVLSTWQLCGGWVLRQSYRIITTHLASFNYERTLRIISANAQETYGYKSHKVAMNSFFLSWKIFSVWKQSEKMLIKKWHKINSYNITQWH